MDCYELNISPAMGNDEQIEQFLQQKRKYAKKKTEKANLQVAEALTIIKGPIYVCFQ